MVGAGDPVDQHLDRDHRKDQTHDPGSDLQDGRVYPAAQFLASENKQKSGDQADNGKHANDQDHIQIDFSAPTKFMAAEMVPGPASSGVPSGVIAMSSRQFFHVFPGYRRL